MSPGGFDSLNSEPDLSTHEIERLRQSFQGTRDSLQTARAKIVELENELRLERQKGLMNCIKRKCGKLTEGTRRVLGRKLGENG
jgi:hypothetical protein